MMITGEFLEADLPQLPALQPPDWGDLVPRFHYFINSGYCSPYKISENEQIVAIGAIMWHLDTAWLACIVVHPDHRNRGLGTTITKELINVIDRETHPTIYLDATDYGFPVYKKLGFELENCYGHFVREGDLPAAEISPYIVPFQEEYRRQLFQLDQQISGEDRSGMLADFVSSSLVFVENDLVKGYYIPGWGDAPILAIDDLAGLELMKIRIRKEEKAILPEENKRAYAFLEQNNFRQYRFSRRMFLGKPKVWKPEKIFNRISGQLG
jgi:GNAT superfamily N-acetyltransferase